MELKEKTEKRKCLQCGTEFVKYHNVQKFCSYKCSYEWAREKAAEKHAASIAARKERVAELEAENARLKEQNDKLEARITELEEQLKEAANAVRKEEKEEAAEIAAMAAYKAKQEAFYAKPDSKPKEKREPSGETRWCKRLHNYIDPALECGQHEDCDIPHACPDKPKKKK